MEEKVDILLATYNGEKYVAEQIESILGQTYYNFNLIISDDCSTDGTAQILEQYANKDKRITINFNKKNLGVVKNIEYLIKSVKSPYFMLADQDDKWMPEKVEKSLEQLKLDEADLVFGDLEVTDEKLNTIYPSFSKYNNLDKKIKKYINSNRLNYLYNCVTGCTVICKKKFINYIVPFPTESKAVIHDHWIGLVLSLKGKVSYMPQTYIKYRQHGNNQVGTKKIAYSFDRFEQVRNHFINVKIGVFTTYQKHNYVFTDKLKKLNENALEYFEMLKTKKNINFRSWKIFYRLYKTESFKYYMLNFLILNLPIFGRMLFKIRKLVTR